MISDSTGGRIPGVKVSLRQTETNQLRTVYADDQGFFRSTDLPVGTYEVRIESPGFAPYLHTGVGLDVGITAHLDVVLPAASVTTQVTVSAQPSPIDASQTSVTSTVDRQRIEDLPVDSRNSLDLVLSMPGVTSSSSQHGGTGSHRALADSGFTFGGLRPRSNSISVDGLDNNDEYTGSSRTELEAPFGDCCRLRAAFTELTGSYSESEGWLWEEATSQSTCVCTRTEHLTFRDSASRVSVVWVQCEGAAGVAR
jgi:hypothetical protein